VSKDKPSSTSSAPRILETDFVRDALDRLNDGLGTREPFLLVTGEAGTGKTTLVRAAIERWGDRATVAFVADPAMSRNEVLEEIARRFGGDIPEGATKPQLLACLEQTITAAAKKNRVPVVVIDDAHEASPEVLGELRLLVNVSAQAGGPLEIVLAGLPALDARLAEPAFAALRQRVAVHVVTERLSGHQSRRLVHEIVAAEEQDAAALFPKKVCRELHAYARGVPRTLHMLATEAARLAKKAGVVAVTAEHVAEAAAALGIERDAGDSAAAVPAPPAGSESAEVTTGRHDAPASRSESADEPPTPHAAALPDDDAPIARAPHDPDADGELKPPVDVAKASDWIGRFISPDEPRFGDLIGTGRPVEFTDPDEESVQSNDPDIEAVLAKLRRRRGRVLPRYRRGRPHAPEWLRTVALILVIIAALVVIAGPAKRMFVSGLSLMSASSERSDDRQPARVDGEVEAGKGETDGAAGGAPPQVKAEAGKTSTPNSAAKPDREPQSRRPAPATRTPEAAPPEPYVPPSSATKSPPAAAAPEANPDQLWAVDVGDHADAGSAGIDRERLVEATGLKGWLVRGASGYRVVLGIYSTRDRAENGARLLLENGLTARASAIPLPPRHLRQ
jgi:type II secretory pathway predicted ATPase ExeA